jgi:hypothetical protein
MVNQRHLDNVEYFKFLGSWVASDTGFTSEIKSSISMAKTAFKNKKILFSSKFGLKFGEEFSEFLHWRLCFNGAKLGHIGK